MEKILDFDLKVAVEYVNPAYTSQTCPSCGHVSRKNRSGIKFKCDSCGRKAHADWVGATNILRRSEDQDIGCGDDPVSVKRELGRRYQALRARSSPPNLEPDAPTVVRESLAPSSPERARLKLDS